MSSQPWALQAELHSQGRSTETCWGHWEFQPHTVLYAGLCSSQPAPTLPTAGALRVLPAGWQDTTQHSTAQHAVVQQFGMCSMGKGNLQTSLPAVGFLPAARWAWHISRCCKTSFSISRRLEGSITYLNHSYKLWVNEVCCSIQTLLVKGKNRSCLLRKKSSLGLPCRYMLISKHYVRSCTSHWSPAQEVIKASVNF